MLDRSEQYFSAAAHGAVSPSFRWGPQILPIREMQATVASQSGPTPRSLLFGVDERTGATAVKTLALKGL